MGNDSSTGGILDPIVASTDPVEDKALVDFIQEVVSGITGVPGKYVRPRWQEEPPNLPPKNINWIALGIESRQTDTYGVEVHVNAVEGGLPEHDELQRHETLNLRCSFYGPNADSLASRLKTGLLVAQNREVLYLAGMGLVETGEPVAVPSLVKEKWLYKVDMTVAIRREIRQQYPVLSILKVVGELEPATPFAVEAP